MYTAFRLKIEVSQPTKQDRLCQYSTVRVRFLFPCMNYLPLEFFNSHLIHKNIDKHIWDSFHRTIIYVFKSCVYTSNKLFKVLIFPMTWKYWTLHFFQKLLNLLQYYKKKKLHTCSKAFCSIEKNLPVHKLPAVPASINFLLYTNGNAYFTGFPLYNAHNKSVLNL